MQTTLNEYVPTPGVPWNVSVIAVAVVVTVANPVVGAVASPRFAVQTGLFVQVKSLKVRMTVGLAPKFAVPADTVKVVA